MSQIKIFDENDYCPGEHRKYWNDDGRTLKMHYFCDENGEIHGSYKVYARDGKTLQSHEFYEHGRNCGDCTGARDPFAPIERIDMHVYVSPMNYLKDFPADKEMETFILRPSSIQRTVPNTAMQMIIGSFH